MDSETDTISDTEDEFKFVPKHDGIMKCLWQMEDDLKILSC